MKITKFIDMVASTPNNFLIDGAPATIVNDWGITQQGTKNKAEYFNEIESNITYDCNTNYINETTKEIYEADLEGFYEFGVFPLKFKLYILNQNVTSNTFVKFYQNGGSQFLEYPLSYYKDGSLSPIPVAFLKTKSYYEFKITNISGVMHAVLIDIHYVLKPATTSTLGGVIVGDNLTVDASGRVSADVSQSEVDSKFPSLGVEIPEGSDLNNYTTPGHYKRFGNATAGTILNNPLGQVAFTLIVDSINPDRYCTQTIIPHDQPHNTQTRAYVDGVWDVNWVKNINENFGEFKTNIILRRNTGELSAIIKGTYYATDGSSITGYSYCTETETGIFHTISDASNTALMERGVIRTNKNTLKTTMISDSININDAPTTSTHGTNKAYVDSKVIPPVGGYITMSNATNPASIYPGTTWSLQSSDVYLTTGTSSNVNTGVSGSSNTTTIALENLPAHSFSRGTMEIAGSAIVDCYGDAGHFYGLTGALYGSDGPHGQAPGDVRETGNNPYRVLNFQASREWTGSSSSVGSGTTMNNRPNSWYAMMWVRLT